MNVSESIKNSPFLMQLYLQAQRPPRARKQRGVATELLLGADGSPQPTEPGPDLGPMDSPSNFISSPMANLRKLPSVSFNSSVGGRVESVIRRPPNSLCPAGKNPWQDTWV
jgi:hypothetical protein